MASSIEFTYSLREDDIYKALKKSGIYKTSGSRMVIENILLLVCGGFFIYSCVKEFSVLSLVLAAVSFGFMAVVTFVPAHEMKKQAKAQANKEIRLRVTPQRLCLEDEEKKWEIRLDGTANYKILDDLILLITADKGLAVLPTKAFPGEYASEIQAKIFAGTKESR